MASSPPEAARPLGARPRASDPDPCAARTSAVWVFMKSGMATVAWVTGAGLLRLLGASED